MPNVAKFSSSSSDRVNITHRLSTVRAADQIVVLDNGLIVEIGSHDQLLNQQGIYQPLHSLQESGELV